MTDSDSIEVVEAPAEKPPKKAKAKTKLRPKLVKDAKARPSHLKAVESEERAHGFDFVGRVESVTVRSGAGPQSFEFGLRGRHGERKNFRLDAAETYSFTAMTNLVIAAHASEIKVGVRTASEAEGVPVVRELECRPKIGRRH